MDLPQYFADVVAELTRRSESLRRDFATHHGSAGGNRESLVAEVLRAYLPRQYRIDTGLITSSDGQFSSQADLIVTDENWNSPLYPSATNRLWLVEAVYALIEVKTSLSPSEIEDSIKKCRRFKRLPRAFSDAPEKPKLTNSLFIVWSFESPTSETLKKNVLSAMANVPVAEQPDFVIVPGQLMASCGSYKELADIGLPGTPYRRALQKQYGPNLAGMKMEAVNVYDLGENSLFGWLIYLLSWLKRAGSRNSELLAYLPPEKVFGRRI